MPLLGNAAVIFERTSATGAAAAPTTGTVVVQVRRVDGIQRPEPWMLTFQWIVRWDSGLTYADGTGIRAGDEIVWSELANGRATLENVLKSYGVLSSSRAGFNESE